MEPRFSLPADTPLSSKKELVIGGVRAYVYGLDELKCSVDDNIAILYLAHNRTRTYKVTEGVAHEVLHRYRTDGRRKKAQLISVTMNMRNHGDREVILPLYIVIFFLQVRDIHVYVSIRSLLKQTGLGRMEMKTMGMSCAQSILQK